MALSEQVENISKYVDEKEIPVGISTDLAIAFDTVKQNIQLYKLHQYDKRFTIRMDQQLF